MRKHKTKIVMAVVVLAALTGAWFWGSARTVNSPETSSAMAAEIPDSSARDVREALSSPVAEVLETFDAPQDASDAPELPATDVEDVPGSTPDEIDAQEEPAESSALPAEPETPDVQIFGEDHPEMREPVEPENMTVGDGSFTVTLSVSAHMILPNMHLLHSDKHELVPEDGIIFPPTEVTAYEGESVFNVLQREMRRARIHMASRFTPMFNSAYVEAINNLYEFDVGPLSGWMYSVNGWFPNFGASRYLLSPGDVIEWVYTVDLGRDLGIYFISGQRDE
jgi:hypothetical protein